jgi:hypothetical protein
MGINCAGIHHARNSDVRTTSNLKQQERVAQQRRRAGPGGRVGVQAAAQEVPGQRRQRQVIAAAQAEQRQQLVGGQGAQRACFQGQTSVDQSRDGWKYLLGL